MESSTTIASTIVENVSQISFSWYDYILFTSMLAVSALIGIYFGCFGSKQSTANEYLMGDKKMRVFPISVSLVASHVSGITLLAVPADVYMHGAPYILISIAFAVQGLATVYVFLPVYYKLQITSTYEYLERRFDSRLRTFASYLFALGVFLYLPIVIYIPALAFSAATGINVHNITPIVCGVCIFYTTLGGLKAVVWTDTLQFVVTVGAVFTVFVLGLKASGGVGPVWDTALRGDRLLNVFDFDLDPTKRESFWIISIGTSFAMIGMGSVHQSCVQKYLSVPTLADANRTVLYFTLGLIGITSFSVFIGLIMYSRYELCDPFTIGVVRKPDQLLPFYILDVASQIPGLSGLFIAGIFCAALSTLSACLNCLSGTIYEDFISKLSKTKKSKESATNTLKLIVIICGAVCTGLVFVIEHLGDILPLAIRLAGVTTGPLVAMFTLGVLFPKVSSKGCLWGSVFGLLFSAWMVTMVQYYKSQGLLPDEHKPTSIEGCPANILNIANSTTVSNNMSFMSTASPVLNITSETTEKYVPFILFRVSHYYYTLIGIAVSMIAANIISFVTRNEDPPVHRDLLSPIIYRFLSDETVIEQKSYFSVDKALHLVTTHNEKEKL